MEQALHDLQTFEPWVWLGLGALAIWQIWSFAQAWQELRWASFGLERDAAQTKLNTAAIVLALLLAVGLGVFTLTTFVAPSLPGANPLPTPTIDLNATPTTTLPPGSNPAGGAATATVEGTPRPTMFPQPEGSQCNFDQVMLTSPKDGEVARGVITLEGTASIPNFGFYKYEWAQASNPVWQTIQAGRTPVVQGKLGEWDTSAQASDTYLLRLVVTDSQGVALPPCIVRVQINNSPPP